MLQYVKLGVLILTIISIIWIGIVAYLNWGTIMSLYKYPTVGSMLYFASLWIYLLGMLLKLVFIILLLIPKIIPTDYKDDMTVAVAVYMGIEIISLIVLISNLVGSLGVYPLIVIAVTILFPELVACLIIYLIRNISDEIQ